MTIEHARSSTQEQLVASSQLCERILALSPVGLVAYSAAGVCVSANPQAARILNCSIEELLTSRLSDVPFWKTSGLLNILETCLWSGASQAEKDHLLAHPPPVAGRRCKVDCFEAGGQTHILISLTESEPLSGDDAGPPNGPPAPHAARYQAILETTPDWIWEITPNGQYTYSSPKVRDLLGYEPEEILGTSAFDLMPEAEAARVLPLFQHLVQHQAPLVRLEKLNLHKNGRVLRLESNGVPILASDGTLLGYRGIDRDITLPRPDHHPLREREADLDGFFCAALDPLCIADKLGYFRRVNVLWEKVFGYTFQELLSRRFVEHVHPDDLAPTEIALAQLAKGSTSSIFINRFRCKNGAYRAIEWRCVSAGELVYATARDVTEHQEQANILSASRFMLQTVLDNIPQRVFWKDRNLRYLGCNRAFAQQAGLSSPELITGKTDLDLPWKDRAATYQEDDSIVIETGAAKLNYEEAFLSPNGKQTWQRTTKFALRSREGEVCGVLGTYEDITDQVTAQEQLRNLNVRFDLAAESAQLGVWDWDIPKDRLFWDQRMYKLYDLAEGSFAGVMDCWIAALHPNDADRCRQDIRRALLGEKEFDTEFRVPITGGQIRYLKAHGRVARDPSGRPLRMTGVNYDITERKHAEQAIHKSHRELRILYSISQSTSESLDLDVVLRHAQETIAELWDVAGTGVYLLREDGKNLFLQSAIGLHPDYTQQIRNTRVGEGISGKAILSKVPVTMSVTEHPEGAAKQTLMALGYRTLASIPLSTARASIGAMQIVLRHEKRFDTEEIRLLQAVGQQLGTSIQNAQLYQSIARELEERTRIEAKLVEATRQAETANVAKSEFLANMSHEIRTPMNAIVGLGHLVLQTELSAKQREYLVGINASAQSLLSILNHILDLSKIEAGMMSLERSDFSLQDSLQKVASLATIRSEPKAIELLVHVGPEVPDGLIGDALRLEQVLINLLGNAIKFTDRGHVFLDVNTIDSPTDSPTSESISLRFSVTDTGIGIASDRMKGLFQPFTQTDASTTRRFGGTGLGLSICKSLVELMDGTMEVESTLGQGSVFAFTSKFGRSELAQCASTQNPPDLTGLKVMIIDGDLLRRQILQEILTARGVQVATMNSGRKALEELLAVGASGTERPYRLVLMDKNLADLDAVAFAEQLRSSNQGGTVPLLVMVAATGDDWLRARASELGLSALLAKPILPRVLCSAVLEATRDARTLPPAAQPFGEVNSVMVNRLRGAHVLLVEDHPLNQQIAQEILEQAGVVVDVVDNGLDAVERLSLGGGNYDAVLMDVQMPTMDGFEATRRIRRMWSSEELPIIAMTAHAFNEEREKCLDAGMNGHIAKPINVTDLYSRLAACIGTGASRSSMPPRNSADGTVPRRPAVVPSGLPGIDMQDGLARVCGNLDLFRKLVVDFSKSGQMLVDEIQIAFGENNTKAISEMAHTLKGISANVGARTVSAAAVKLEQTLKSGQRDQIRQAVTDLSRLFAEAFDTVDSVIPSTAKPSPALPTQSQEVPVAALEPLLKDLSQALVNRSLQALRPVDQIAQLLEPTAFAERGRELAETIDNLDFGTALQQLSELAAMLHISSAVPK